MFVVILVALCSRAFSDDDRHLKLKDLEDFVKKDGLNVILIKKEKAEEHEKLFSTMRDVFKGFVRFAVIEYSDKLPEKYKSTKYPAIKVLSENGKAIVDYSKAVTPQEIYEYVSSRVQEISKKRLQSFGFVEPETYVVTLDEANFTSTIRNSDEHFLVEFYAPWCGHCKSLAPVWKDAAKKLHGKVKLAAVDCTVNQMLASDFGIKGYPTIKFIPARSADPKESAEEYNGGRTVQSIIEWVDSKLPSLLPPPDLIHVTSQADLEKECFSKSLCVAAFLPNRLDTDSQTWNKYINILKGVIDSQKDMGYGWVWIEGANDDKFEETFGVGGFGYPALTVISHKKKAYSIMRDAFDVTNIKRFLISLGSKSSQTQTVSGEIPTFKQAKEWNGAEFYRSDL